MPVVDLSRIGIEGIESAARVDESRARTAAMEQGVQDSQVSNADKLFDLSRKVREQELADTAAGMVGEIAAGGSGRLPPGESSDGAEMGSLADPLLKLAGVFMKGGAPETGMEFLKSASEVQKREADMRKDEIKSRGDQLDNMSKAADLVSAQVGTAQTQEEWDQGWQVVEQSGLVPPNLIDMFKSQGFSHDMVALVNEQAMGAKERADLDRQALNLQRQQLDSESSRAYRDRMIQISRGRLEEQRKTRERLERQGKSASAPSTAEVTSTTAAIINSIMDGKDPRKTTAQGSPIPDPVLQAGAYSIASRAKQLVTDNKALDWDTAVARAIEESKAAGDWEAWTESQTIFGLEIPGTRDPIAPKYKPQGKTAKSAAPLPMVNGQVDPTKLVVGRYYIVNGKPKKFTGE